MSNQVSAESFYTDILKLITKSEIPFLLGGAHALQEHTGINRDTKDLDLFVKPGDYTKILKLLMLEGWQTEITDSRWLAKARHNDHFIDLIFSTPSGVFTVDDTWFTNVSETKIFNSGIKYLTAEELILTKATLMDRGRFDGADVNHIILKQGRSMDWGRLMMRMEPYWEILLAHLVMFRFVYPTDLKCIPKKVFKELLDRLEHQLVLPLPKEKICRGPILSRTQYEVDIKRWGYQSFT